MWRRGEGGESNDEEHVCGEGGEDDLLWDKSISREGGEDRQDEERQDLKVIGKFRL